MKDDQESQQNSPWQKTQFANLVRYKASGVYFARMRVQGKLIRRSLTTDSISVAKLRLSDLEAEERKRAENQTAVAKGKVTFGSALGNFQRKN